MPDMNVTLVPSGAGNGDYDLVVGDAFALELSYDADDDRWHLWTIRYGDGREGIAVEGDRRHGEPMPYGSLVAVLDALVPDDSERAS